MKQSALEAGLSDIKHRLIEMAGYVEVAIDSATASWRTRSVERISQVYEIEKKVYLYIKRK